MELFISDLDGTLLNSEQYVSEESIKILNNLISKGLNFSVATARSINSARKIIEPLNLKLPIILHNGVFIYDPVTKENIVENYINSELAADIIKTCDEFRLSPMIFTLEEEGPKIFYKGIFNAGEEDFVKSRTVNGDKRFHQVKTFPLVNKKNIITIIVIGDDKDLRPLYERLNRKYDLVYHYAEDIYTKFYWLEITNKGADKKTAVEYLKKYLNATKLICFGDNLNDCSMFEVADEKYAVSNGCDALKKSASKVIGSNDDNAVAKFIEEYWKPHNT